MLDDGNSKNLAVTIWHDEHRIERPSVIVEEMNVAVLDIDRLVPAARIVDRVVHNQAAVIENGAKTIGSFRSTKQSLRASSVISVSLWLGYVERHPTWDTADYSSYDAPNWRLSVGSS